MKFSPKNRYLLVQTQKQEDADTGVLLPEGYALRKDKYVTATVLDTATDCKDVIAHGTQVVVDASMLEEVSVSGQTFEIVLENYVVGLLQ
tara:strand:- start:393 stop:662 length:270 start_codon:yes stop_codon:yes gene_type:complete